VFVPSSVKMSAIGTKHYYFARKELILSCVDYCIPYRNVGLDIKQIIEHLNFVKQLERRKQISIEHYTHIYSKQDKDVIYFSPEIQNFKDNFTHFVFKGIKDHKRQYI